MNDGIVSLIAGTKVFVSNDKYVWLYICMIICFYANFVYAHQWMFLFSETMGVVQCKHCCDYHGKFVNCTMDIDVANESSP